MCHPPKVFLLKLIIESSLRLLSLYFNLTKLTFIFFSFRMSVVKRDIKLTAVLSAVSCKLNFLMVSVTMATHKKILLPRHREGKSNQSIIILILFRKIVNNFMS